MVWLLYFCILLPVFFRVGTLTLPPYRILFLLTIIPAGVMLLSGKFGKVRMVDWMFILYCLWVFVALFVVHGFMIYQLAGYTAVETLGAYLLGRMVVRNAATFRTVVRVHFVSVLLMLPFAIVETQTGYPVIIGTLKPFIQTHPIVTYPTRMGLERAQVLMQHPITFGVYCAASFGAVWIVLGMTSSKFMKLLRSTAIGVATICSVSSGALLTLVLQLIFMSYDWVMARMSRRWSLFAGLFLFAYVSVDLLSNRSPFAVFVSYLTFDPSTAYNRIRIWEFGSANVMKHPIFGIGLKDWERPSWMVSSVDNHWMVVAMRSGLPGVTLNLGALLLLVRQLGRKEIRDPAVQVCRAGFLVSLGATMVAACTVYMWGPVFIWFMFFIGSSLWMLDPEPEPETAAAEPAAEAAAAPRRSPYSRFAATRRRH